MEPLTPSLQGTPVTRAGLSQGLDNGDQSGVSWPAVWAGGFVTAALSLILLALGTGLGFASASFWQGHGASASTLSAGAIFWLIFIQFVSASMGGYLAGRLRTKWTNVHGDEVYFRDTAHGFLAWSVALVVSAAFLTTAATSLTGRTESSREGVAAGQGQMAANDYFVDSLFRGDGSKPETEIAPAARQAATVFAFALQHGGLSAEDKTYLEQMVVAIAGATPADARQRVSDTYLGAQTAAETTRKAIAHTLLWTFVALLIGAFCSSFAGTIGGRQRDHVVVI
jgi:hypothetical protein